MRRLIINALLFAAAANAAFWDGTKGSITISTVGDDATTVISVSSTDRSVSQIEVAVSEKCSLAGPCEPKITRVTIPVIPHGKPYLAVFQIPETHIASVAVTSRRDAETQVFKQ